MRRVRKFSGLDTRREEKIQVKLSQLNTNQQEQDPEAGQRHDVVRQDPERLEVMGEKDQGSWLLEVGDSGSQNSYRVALVVIRVGFRTRSTPRAESSVGIGYCAVADKQKLYMWAKASQATSCAPLVAIPARSRHRRVRVCPKAHLRRLVAIASVRWENNARAFLEATPFGWHDARVDFFRRRSLLGPQTGRRCVNWGNMETTARRRPAWRNVLTL